jgi:hypothetical protein
VDGSGARLALRRHPVASRREVRAQDKLALEPARLEPAVRLGDLIEGDALGDARPDGSTQSWANEQTGHRGSLTPTRTYISDSGSFCREYREELVVGEQSGRFYHAACRDENARWAWL